MADKNSFLKNQTRNVSSTYKQWSKANKKYQKKQNTQTAKTGERQYMTTAKDYAARELAREQEEIRQREAKRRREIRQQQEAIHQQQLETGNRLTNTWKDQAGRDTAATGNTFRTYQEKMQADAAGTSYRQKQAEGRKNLSKLDLAVSESTKNWRDNTAHLQNAGMGGLSYAQKMMADTGVKDQTGKVRTANIADKSARWDKFLEDNGIKTQRYSTEQAEQAARTMGKGHAGYDVNKGEIGKMTVPNYNAYMEGLWAKKDSGLNDEGYNPWVMTEEGRQRNIPIYKEKAGQAAKQAEDVWDNWRLNVEKAAPDKLWSRIFDLTEEMDQRGPRSAAMGAGTQEERQGAAAALDSLRGSMEGRRDEILQKANDFFLNEYDQEQWTQDWNSGEQFRSAMRKRIYDQIMPDTYDERTANMDPELQMELDKRIDEIVETANNMPTIEWYARDEQEQQYRLVAESYQKRAEEAETAQATMDKVSRIMAQMEDAVPSAAYNPEYIKTHYDETAREQITVIEPEGSKVDKAYYWMNNKPTQDEPIKSLEVRKEYFATQEMTDTFTSLYDFDRQNGTNMAGQFLDAITPYLDSCYAQWYDWMVREASEDPVAGVPLRILSYPLNLIGGFAGMAGTGMAVMGNEDAQKGNSKWYNISRAVQTLREEQNEDASESVARYFATDKYGNVNKQTYDRFLKGTRFLLNTADSIGDNLMAMTAAKGLSGDIRSKAGKRLVQLFMSSEAVANTMWQKLDEGMDPTEAALYAVGDGLIEWVTERVSLEALLNPSAKEFLGDWRKMIRFFNKASVAEGSEEIAADLLNWGLDEVMAFAYKHQKEIDKRAGEMIIDEGMKPEEAYKAALKEKFHQMGLSGLAGALSGGVLSGMRIASNAVTQVKTGAAVSDVRNTQEDVTGKQRVIDLGKAMNQGTLSNETAARLQQKIDSGKNVTSYEVGKLAQQIAMETGEQQAQIANDTLKLLVKDQLKSAGVEAGEADNYAEIIAKDLTGGEGLSAADRIRLARNENAIQLWKAYNSDTELGRTMQAVAGMEIQEKTAAQKSVMDTLGELTGETVPGKSIMAAEVDEARRNTKTDAEALDYIRQHNTNLVSEEFITKAKELLDSDEKAKQTKTYVDDVMKIMWAAKTLDEKIPATNLSAETAQALYDQARAEFEEADRLRLESGQVKVIPGRGQVDFRTKDGKTVEYGSEAWEQQKQTYNKEIRNHIGAVELIARQFGHTLHFIDDPDLAMVNGWESQQDGSIVINIAQGMQHSMMATVVHEMTHWLEQNSWDEYNRLRKFILDTYRKQGKSIEALLMAKINNQHRVSLKLQDAGQNQQMNDLTIEGAMKELVANSAEAILTSREFKEAVATADPGLFNTIKRFVRNVVARIDNALKNTTGRMSMESQLLTDVRDELAHLWLETRREAITRQQTGESKAEGRSYSIEQVNEDYSAAEEANDEARMRQALDEAARMHGYSTERAYHGTPDFGFTTFDLGRGRNAIFVAFGEEAARHYNNRGQVRQISTRALGDIGAMTDAQLLTEARKWITERRGDAVDSIELLDNGKYRVSWFDTDDGRQKRMDWSRREMEQEIRKAARNAGQMNGTYELYTRPGNQFVMDANENKSTEIHIDGELADALGADIANTRMIARWARENGYDSVRINNVRDAGGVVTDYGIFFRESDVKSADLRTYDDNGNLIRPDQRFTEQGDIRYSVTTIEEEYEAAVRNNDTETMQRLVDEKAENVFAESKVRDADGKLLKMYHGTNADFTEFRRDMIGSTGRFEGSGFNFTPAEGRASSYGKNVLEGYLNIVNPLSAEKKTISVRKLAELIRKADPTGDNIIADYARETRDYGQPSFVLRESMTAARNIWESSDNDVDIYSFISSADSDAESMISVFSDMGYDGLIHYYDDGKIKTAVAFSSSQFKLSNPVTYDDAGNVIPLSERFNEKRDDIRYSVEPGQDPVDVPNDKGEPMFTILPGNTIAATPYSLSSYTDLNERGKMVNALKKAGYSEEQIKAWIDQLDTLALKIASNRLMYDFVADRNLKFLKPNGDVYKKTLDANTMCQKTRLYNGTFNLVQHMLPNTTLTPADLIDLFNLMKDEGLETPCKFCYVQSRRRHLGTYAEKWLQNYKGAYKPTMDEVTTSDGQLKLKQEHPKTYRDFVSAMNRLGVNNPKLVQERTDYRGEIRRMKDSTIRYLNAIGGLRIQSFSDFELVHALDMMQIVMDMTAKKLMAQAYTKVPAFAWIFGATGIKINLSLVGKGSGLDAQGNLIFDDDEGISHEEAWDLRNAYSKNVGTIIVGINDEHIIACMGDERIDFIIPFHKSGWSADELNRMRGLKYYEDYTDSQNEYNITGKNVDGSLITEKAESNIDPKSYWEFDKNGEYNARKYLQYCADHKIVPKFSQFLEDKGNGVFALPEGQDKRSTNIRTGYWKTLIDFKMYDNEGNGADQQTVKPTFNMTKLMQLMDAYEGDHRALPQSWKAAEKFVERYKEAHPLGGTRLAYSVEESPDMDVERFMLGLNEFHMNTVQERIMLRQFKELRSGMEALRWKIDERSKEIKALEEKEDKNVYDREKLRAKKNIQQNDQSRYEGMRKELVRVTTGKGYAKLMRNAADMMANLVTGRTSDDVRRTVKNIENEVSDVEKEMAARAEKLKALAEKEAVVRIRALFSRTGLKQIAAKLKADMVSDLDNKTIENKLALIALKMKQGRVTEESMTELADLLMGTTPRAYDSYIINELRGTTLTLSKAQMKELKAGNRTLTDISRQLAGTGIRISGSGNTTLEAKWDELCELIPALDRNAPAGDMLDQLVNLIVSEKAVADSQYTGDEARMHTVGQIAIAAAQLLPEIVNDKKSMELLKDTLDFVHAISAEAKAAGETLEDVGSLMASIRKAGLRAEAQTEKLTGDVRQALEYFDELGKQSEAALWKGERIRLINQLKTESTQAILEEQAKWKERMQKDKTAREQMQSNLQLRMSVNTNFTRIRNLLVNETDQKHMPEYMKTLARYMLNLITDNDLTGRKLTGVQKKDLVELKRVLATMDTMEPSFTMQDLLEMHDPEAQAAVADALADLEEGIEEYNTKPSKQLLVNLQHFHDALEKISDAVAVIKGVIDAQRNIDFYERRVEVSRVAGMIRADMGNTRFKGEWNGKPAGAVNAINRAVVYGNTTPVYYFKNLRNRGMDLIWNDFATSENRNGLAIQKAQAFIKGLAEKTGYRNWAEETHEAVIGGRKVTLTIDNMMELYAIWRREKTLNPEMSNHLATGGVYIQDDSAREGKLRREYREQLAHRVTDEEIAKIHDQLTDAQKEYLESMVQYLSNDMSELGNEASMRMYGIKKYKESYYFPMKVWDGVKSARSDRGISGTDENRAAHKGWSKRRKNMANNALVIGSFTEDAVNHIVEMINYNTMAPAIENMNKVLNYQFMEEGENGETKRNLRVLFQQAYGKESLHYLEEFMKDLNGGMVQDQRKTLRDQALTLFKKNAVAGSLSVAAQQPLSYIRAAMMVNPKYLAAALDPKYYKGSWQEMLEHSGVAVIKEMGRFDMNFGRSAKDWISPETNKGLYDRLGDALTELPQKMDRMTWTRMWTAVKLEQKALHPEMGMKDNEFLDLVGRRFNDLMRRTQVYDSVLVKSSNMRSTNYGMKLITSFMAEPTLSLNVLADAVRNAREKGGMANVAKAAATFLLSAVLQATVKGIMGSGRTPDEKKTWWENFLNKFGYNLMNEANPASLIPGYSSLIEILKTGKLQDDAMGAIGKIFTTGQVLKDWITGERNDYYRIIEDSVGQIAQLFTNIPAKNLMRDTRAMANLFLGAAGGLDVSGVTGGGYANRKSSWAVIRQQAIENLVTADNLLGTVNTWLADAGYRTTASAYYGKIYNAMKSGDTKGAEELKEYLTVGKGYKAETVAQGIKKAAKADSSMSDAERSSWMIKEGMMDKLDDITSQYKAGKITRSEAEKLMKQMDPKITKDEIYWKLDLADYKAATGKKEASGYYYRLTDAVNANSATQIQEAVKALLAHGITKEKIKGKLSDWKKEYLAADAAGRRKIRDAIEKAYKAAGYTVKDADKTIDGWTKEQKKTTK